ncbi:MULTISPECIES: C40 family peptidase [Nocardiaceae]|uniref:C40 family peptidase n=1 Tax=Nocardiaceae TaxID=85025 RepID=UPI001E2B3159|nr:MULTISPECIES: C40 family peptidase [Rhodococcus]MCC8927782.1 C40 family peptidase [Rhodococcus sp. I2R]MCZ4275591.1 C40 family peptidase [Rhodococcus yunnanensis]
MASHTSTRPLRRILVAGAITAGAVILPAAPAMAAPITIPGVGTFEIPEIPGMPPLPAQVPAPNAPAPVAPQVTPAAKAVQAAETKIGAPYVYGASGPDSFDCSGLVQWAYKQAGVSLPRTSYDQAAAGTPVSKADLRPGDVVSFYDGSHSGIYSGNGNVIHASTSGVPVKVAPVDSMPFDGARRY